MQNVMVTVSRRTGLFERIVFDLLFFNLFAITPLYFTFPQISNVISSSIVVIIPFAISIILSLKNIVMYKKKSKGTGLFFCLILFFLFLALGGNNYMKELVYSSAFMLYIGITLFILTRKSIESTVSHIKYISFLIIIVCLIAHYMGVYVSDSYENGMNLNYMAFGYTVSLQALILYALSESKIGQVFSIISMIFTCLYGNRAVLIIYALFGAIRIIKKVRSTGGKVSRKQIIFVMSTIIATMFISVNFERFLNFLLLKLEEAGTESRMLNQFISGTLFESKSRAIIYERAIQIIHNEPLKIHGPGYLTTIMTSVAHKRLNGANAHNIFLELYIEYGVFFGNIILFYFFDKLYRSIRLNMDYPTICSTLAFIMLLQAMVMLMFSGSLYSSVELWIGLAILSACNRKIKEAGRQ